MDIVQKSFIIMTLATSILLMSTANAYAAEDVPTFTAKVGQLKKITFKITNGAGVQQPFFHFIQVKNPSGIPEQLSWVGGLLLVDQEIRPQQSWIPEKVGEYTIEIFVFACFELCSPLSPVLTMKVIVEE
ncbi:MAG: hypothetical protein ACRD38_07565 [Nitrososphaerales archaeon]